MLEKLIVFSSFTKSIEDSVSAPKILMLMTSDMKVVHASEHCHHLLVWRDAWMDSREITQAQAISRGPGDCYMCIG